MPLKGNLKNKKKKLIRKTSHKEVSGRIKKYNFYYFPSFLLLVLFFAAFFSFLVINDVRETALKVLNPSIQINQEVDKNFVWQSFGDNFSSSAHLNEEKTNLVLDNFANALSFPPLYDVSVSGLCSNESCDFPAEEIITKDGDFYRLINIYPKDLEGRKIVFSALYELEEKEVAVFIVLEGAEERVYAYFYNPGVSRSTSFVPILGPDSNLILKTQYGRGGGKIAVGGSDNNFIILYIGYEGLALNYQDEKISNISRFFGLRISDGGFTPYIIKQGSGNNSLWYVLSLDADKFKFFKLWQNGTNDIAGIYDLSLELEAQLSTWQSFYAKKRTEISFITEDEILIDFVDEGFDNKKNRQALSLDLAKGRGLVARARLSDFYFSGNCQLEVSNNGDDFFAFKNKREIIFKELGKSLFWRVNCPKSSDQEYSPWLDNINSLDYLISL